MGNSPNRHQETKNKHGYATSPTLLLIVRNFQVPKSSTHDISNTYKITMLEWIQKYDKAINVGLMIIYLPSPPHIIASEITPTGDSRQKTTAQIIKIKT